MEGRLAAPSTTPEHRNQVKEIIRGPVSTMTAILQVDQGQQRAMWTFWLDCLMQYQIDEIRAAFIAHVHQGSGYPNPQSIVRQINVRRERVGIELARVRRASRQEADDIEYDRRLENRMTPEAKARILKELSAEKKGEQ